MYENLVYRLRKAAGPALDFPDTLYDEAADAIEELNKRLSCVMTERDVAMKNLCERRKYE